MADCATRAHPHNSPLRSECSAGAPPLRVCVRLWGEGEHPVSKVSKAASFEDTFHFLYLLMERSDFLSSKLTTYQLSSAASQETLSLASPFMFACFLCWPQPWSLRAARASVARPSRPERLRLKAEDRHVKNNLGQGRRSQAAVSDR